MLIIIVLTLSIDWLRLTVTHYLKHLRVTNYPYKKNTADSLHGPWSGTDVLQYSLIMDSFDDHTSGRFFFLIDRTSLLICLNTSAFIFQDYSISFLWCRKKIKRFGFVYLPLSFIDLCIVRFLTVVVKYLLEPDYYT